MARPRTFAEQDVIAAARDQFWSAGYAGTSLDDLTEATGLGRGSLYGAFGDKHELFLRALEDYCGTVMTRATADLCDGPGTGYQRLVGHIRAMANPTAAQAQRGCLMAKSATELGATDDEVLARVRRSLQNYQSALRSSIDEAQRAGELAGAADPDELALVVLTFLRGSEALRKGGFPVATMRTAAEQFIALLPAPG
jgi:TetR/AcrR family transcriptional repressor of nem operon